MGPLGLDLSALFRNKKTGRKNVRSSGRMLSAARNEADRPGKRHRFVTAPQEINVPAGIDVHPRQAGRPAWETVKKLVQKRLGFFADRPTLTSRSAKRSGS
jgi:hypothetical protein